MKDSKEKIKELTEFMLAKSTAANVEPVFTTKDGKEITLGENLTAILNDVLEQAFIPFLAEELVKAGYSQRDDVSNPSVTPLAPSSINPSPSDNIEEVINEFFDGKCGEHSCWFGFEGEEQTCRHCLAEYLKEKDYGEQNKVVDAVFEDIETHGLVGGGIILSIEEYSHIKEKYKNKTK